MYLFAVESISLFSMETSSFLFSSKFILFIQRKPPLLICGYMLNTHIYKHTYFATLCVVFCVSPKFFFHFSNITREFSAPLKNETITHINELLFWQVCVQLKLFFLNFKINDRILFDLHFILDIYFGWLWIAIFLTT